MTNFLTGSIEFYLFMPSEVEDDSKLDATVPSYANRFQNRKNDTIPPTSTSEIIVIADGVEKQMLKVGNGSSKPQKHATCFGRNTTSFFEILQN